jgi:hypothetical protein
MRSVPFRQLLLIAARERHRTGARSDHRLPDWSPEGFASAVDEMRTLRAPEVSTPQRGGRATGDRELAIAFDIQIAELRALTSTPTLRSRR